MKIVISHNMKKQYVSLDKPLKKKVKTAIVKLRKGEINIEKLSAGKNIYKIKIGDYRILVEKLQDVYIIAGIDSRKDVYRNL